MTEAGSLGGLTLSRMTTASSQIDRTGPLLTECEVAGVFRVSGRTVRRWAASGILPAIQIGGVRRYSADRIAALIDPSTSIGHAGGVADAKTDGGIVGHAQP